MDEWSRHTIEFKKLDKKRIANVQFHSYKSPVQAKLIFGDESE